MTAPNPDHPAKFSEPILDRLRVLINAERKETEPNRGGLPLQVIDIYAGVGRIHQLAVPARRGHAGIATTGIELEPEWAACHPRTICADSLSWMVRMIAKGWCYHVAAFSPTYGNRLSDCHDAQDGSVRHSYTHDLGRTLSPGTSANLPWGPKYWAHHGRSYGLLFDLMIPGGLVLLNVSNFYRGKELVHAVEWHRGAMYGAGFLQGGRTVPVVTSRMRGVGDESTAARADHEVILRFRKPLPDAP